MVSSEFWQWFNDFAAPKIDAGPVIRSNTFRKAFEYLDRFDSPIIIETGCTHEPGEDGNLCWGGHGCSTLLFDKYVSINGGHFWSVELNPERVRHTEKLIGKNSQISCGDSIEFLTNFAKYDQFPSPHLVYLDSFDIEWHIKSESQVHHYSELRAIFPKITTDTLVLVDDSPFLLDEDGNYRVSGKGGLIAEYAVELGVPLAFSEYQTAWLGFPGSRDYRKTDNNELVLRALCNRASDSLLIKAALLLEAEKYEECEILCDEVISREHFLGDAFNCKAAIKAKCGDHEDAIELYRQALTHFCTDKSGVYYNLGLSLHSIGQYKEGWQCMFLARLGNVAVSRIYAPIRRFADLKKQLFVMQPPPASIHIHAEAGEGDNIAFLRYLPLLLNKGYTVRYEAKPSLLKLAQGSFPNIEIVPQAEDYPGTLGIRDFDYHLPITNLPLVFGTDIDTVPWNGSYVKADLELSRKYELYKNKIGIVWSSGPDAGILRGRYARHKSIPFGMLKPIIDVDPAFFVSLQAGLARSENNGIVDCLPRDKDLTWSDTAALIENLDLVITVDTSVAHLAGSMGKPTWLMMHGHARGWHFMCEREGASWNTTSPWYPSMRIFRQKSRGDWKSVAENIALELKVLKASNLAT